MRESSDGEAGDSCSTSNPSGGSAEDLVVHRPLDVAVDEVRPSGHEVELVLVRRSDQDELGLRRDRMAHLALSELLIAGDPARLEERCNQVDEQKVRAV